MVRLLSEYTGRGPTKARTYINEELISIVLQDTLTKGEQSLVRDGNVELVLASRKAYQNTMRADLVEAVEGLTGREVLAFLSDNHLDPDVAVESFVLRPRADGSSANGATKETKVPSGQVPGSLSTPTQAAVPPASPTQSMARTVLVNNGRSHPTA